MVDLVSRLVDFIPWPVQRSAMGDVALTLLHGRHRVAEDVFGWNGNTVQLGIHEFQSGITCVNDLSSRQKHRTEENEPKLLDDIHSIMTPKSHFEPRLRTTLLYTNLTAQGVYDSLRRMGWSKKKLPTVRTVSNILARHNYRLRTVEKTKVQKKRSTPMQSSRTSAR
ncbi:MAG: transposase [Thermodesulfovibrionales bacterium]|jgi:hypothetical protein